MVQSAAGRAGHAVLAAGGSALDAVTEAVKTLEDDPAFDAGENRVESRDCNLSGLFPSHSNWSN